MYIIWSDCELLQSRLICSNVGKHLRYYQTPYILRKTKNHMGKVLVITIKRDNKVAKNIPTTKILKIEHIM